MTDRGLILDVSGLEYAGMGVESRIRKALCKVLRDNVHWTGVELSPEHWDELLWALDARHASWFRVEVGTSRPIILWAVLGRTASVTAADDLTPGEVRVVDGRQW